MLIAQRNGAAQVREKLPGARTTVVFYDDGAARQRVARESGVRG